VRSEEFVVPGIRELVEITGLTYAAANARLWKYRRGCIDRRGLLETRAQAMRRKAANLWGIPDGGNAEWLSLDDDNPHDERLAAIPGSTAWERRSC
jgi:hypothetical protein